MIDAVTFGELKTMVRGQADMAETTFVDDTQLSYWLNAEFRELYDLLVSVYPECFLAQKTYTVATGDEFVQVPDDFFKIVKVFTVNSSGDRTALDPFMLDDLDKLSSTEGYGTENPRYRLLSNRLYLFPIGTESRTLELWYCPRLPRYLSDGQYVHFSVPVGWEEFVVAGAVARCLAKEESDPTMWLRRKEQMRAHIVEMGTNRDLGGTDYVADVYNRFGMGDD